MNYLILLIIFTVLNFTLFSLNEFIAKKIDLYDFPDFKRKIHSKKVPVTGGIFLYINIIIFLIIININNSSFYNMLFDGNRELFSFIFLISSLFVIGLYDDKYNLRPIPKISISTIAILISILLNKNLLLENLSFDTFNYHIELSNISTIFSVICVLIFLNALNMFDGIDSQVSIYSIFILLYIINKSSVTALVFIFPALIFSVLYNFRKKLFLGDSGTNILAGLISFCLIKFYNSTGNFATDEIFLLMMIPGIDMTRLFIIRVINRKNPFFADNNHIHHLYLRKYTQKITFFIIQFQILIPIVLYYFFNVNLLFLILLSLIIYIFVIFYFSNK